MLSTGGCSLQLAENQPLAVPSTVLSLNYPSVVVPPSACGADPSPVSTAIGAGCAAVFPLPKGDVIPPSSSVSLPLVPDTVAVSSSFPLSANIESSPALITSPPSAAAMPVSPKDSTIDSIDNLPEQTTDFSLKMSGDNKVREYQKELANPGINGENYIVIAPTGSGKTLVAALVISDHLQKNQQCKSCHVVFVVNTKPLAEQQKLELEDLIPKAQVEVFSGDYSTSVADSIKVNNISVCTAGKFREDIRKGSVKFDELSLLIFDECHHASQKGHDYARLLEHYLEQKKKGLQNGLPQVIGMTASPGAGGSDLDEEKCIDHLVKLAAFMNATHGYHMVTKNQEELDKHSKNSPFQHNFLKPRELRGDPFTERVKTGMIEVEAHIPQVKIECPRLTQAYGSKVQQLKENSDVLKDERARDISATLDLLGCYSDALQTYKDLRLEDALEVIEGYDGIPQDDSKATQHELAIKGWWKSLVDELKQIPVRTNCLLESMKDTLRKTFETEPSSRALIFVPKRKYAYSICDWLLQHPTLKEIIKPDVIIGRYNQGMSLTKQEDVMDSFRTGKTNLLVATSVAEEGIDVPECNLVIRYQHVSNEISLRQIQGRARAEKSQGISIISSDSTKKYKEIKNIELDMLVDEIMKNSSSHLNTMLKEKLEEIQEAIVCDRRRRVERKARLRQSQASKEIQLFCKRCKEFACYGTDIYLVENHHVVPVQEFQKKIKLKEHHDTKDLIVDSVSKTHKIHCANCDLDWGVNCRWKSGDSFPVIKCIAFTYEIAGNCRTIKKWSQAPFKLKPLSNWLSPDGSSSEEEQE